MRTGETMIGRSLEYVVSMTRANTHYLDVTLRVNFQGPTSGPMKLMMPVWTPGHYAIEDMPRNVLEVRAKKETGGGWEDAKVEKESKNVWRVEWTGSAGAVLVEYSVYAFEYHDTKSYVDPIHAIINGAGVFIYPSGGEGIPIQLRLVPYPGWQEVATGLDQVSKWEFTAPNLDVLIDSPIEVGNQQMYSFRVGDVEHQVSLFGASPFDTEKMVEDIKRIVETEIRIFGHIPYKRYVFIVNLTDEVGGGLEHLNSTVCFAPRLRFLPKEEYNLMMGLFSHEFFHTWNVKRMRPKGLGPFNYSAETYTRSLWIAEGITSYYDDYVLRRAGIYTVPEFLEAFVININTMKSLPGGRWQSAQESSFDTWIKYYRTDANSPNVTLSYYTQGAVIGWMLDLQIRRNTKGEKSLDDVMKRAYEQTYVKEGRGYTDEEFESTALDVGGVEGIKEIFESRVRGRKEVDFDHYLAYAGLKLEPKDSPEKVRGFLGVRLNPEGGRTVVRSRLAGSPAESMGLSVNDEILGVDGLRVGSEKLSFYVSNAKPGARVRLTISRNGMLSELAGELGKRPPFEFRITPLKEPSEEQKSLFRDWLMEDWKAELKYPEFSKSPDRKQVLDFV
ncbi:MAG TPA: PDZ domain-containing protein [Nitrososphaerales archaeon]|nr:PDZ domain-containing protein [Nitrososphaerales archaeon]